MSLSKKGWLLIMTMIAPLSMVSAGESWMKKTGTYVVFETTEGTIVCRFFNEKAPKTVDNFVGLAEGTKEFTDPQTGAAVKRPYYDGVIFHRVIPDFMIQGGDPLGQGTGGPGYDFADELDPALGFDKPGLLAMANRGPNTNGSQFFITVAVLSLPRNYTIFGEVVEGQAVANAISLVKRDGRDKPLTPVVMKTVRIHRVK
jgi:peptidyl-prolyl cis-trans isomerase A (cyclophilin A)